VQLSIRIWLITALFLISGSVTMVLAEQHCDDGKPLSIRSYEQHIDGVVIDRQKGLMWMRCAYGQQWSAGRCKRHAETFTWREAQMEIAKFNENGGAFGFTDWRLPTLDEMLSITIPECEKPALDLGAFPDAPITAYWTSTPDPIYPPGVILVHFINGHVYMGNRSVAWVMRLVRRS